MATIADYCKDCVNWLEGRCDGQEEPKNCWSKETYGDWDNCDDLLDWFDLI